MEDRAVAVDRELSPFDREIMDQKEALSQLEIAIVSLEERLAPVSRGDVPELGGGSEPVKSEVHGSGKVYSQLHDTTIRVMDLVRRVRKTTNILEV